MYVCRVFYLQGSLPEGTKFQHIQIEIRICICICIPALVPARRKEGQAEVEDVLQEVEACARERGEGGVGGAGGHPDDEPAA